MRARSVGAVAGVVILGLLVGLLGGPQAGAAVCPDPTDQGSCEGSIALTIAAGTRSISVGTVGVQTGSRPNFDFPYNLTVTSTARNGTNPWKVTALMSTLTFGTNTILASAGTLTGRTQGVTYTVPSITVAACGGSEALGQVCTDSTGFGSASGTLDAAQTIAHVKQEDGNVAYTGAITASGTLRVVVPSDKPSGAYTGTLTYDLTV